jgi:hypothetical protein
LALFGLTVTADEASRRNHIVQQIQALLQEFFRTPALSPTSAWTLS